jgi:hypothetical protein
VTGHEHEAEFVAAARQALRTDAAALDALGWWELLAQLDDPTARTALFALFRAQGRELATSPAVGVVLAQPYVELLGLARGSAVAAILRRGGATAVVVGNVTTKTVLLDRPGRGVTLLDGATVMSRPIDAGRLELHEFEIDPAGVVMLDDSSVGAARRRSTFLGRVAVASETLGAAEGAVDLALAHAINREQFGEPIGRFQAVRHLLAWARTDCVAVEAVVREAVRLDTDAPVRSDEVVKALAGRNGRSACERALQVLGGIGFTAEHDHHHHHARVLVLDALLGSSHDLSHALGRWLREERPELRLTTAALA